LKMAEFDMMDILASFGVAILSGMGVGGGGLLVLYLTALKNTPQIQAQSINMIFFICSASASVVYKAIKKSLNYRALLLLLPLGIAGAVLGARVAVIIRPEVLKIIFGWFLIISGSAVFIKKK